MKKIFSILFIFLAVFLLLHSASAANSTTLRLKGRLILQVEDRGRVWYVDPVGLQKHEVTFANALELFKKLSLGITNTDLNKIPINPEAVSDQLDTDQDGFLDKSEVSNGYNPEIASNPDKRGNDKVLPYPALMNRLKGRLLLQVEDRGRIWYVDMDGKRWEVTWGNIMNLFRKLALGIKNSDLDEVGEWQTYHSNSYGFEFQFPSGWPLPVSENSNLNSGGAYPADEDSQWRLYIGEKTEGLCEGVNCYRFYFDGYSAKNYNTVLDDLKKNNDFIKIVKETTINGNKAILYNEGGICEDKVVFIFTNSQAIKFSGHCIGSNSRLEGIFDKILSTLKSFKPTGTTTSTESQYKDLILSEAEVKEYLSFLKLDTNPEIAKEFTAEDFYTMFYCEAASCDISALRGGSNSFTFDFNNEITFIKEEERDEALEFFKNSPPLVSKIIIADTEKNAELFFDKAVDQKSKEDQYDVLEMSTIADEGKIFKADFWFVYYSYFFRIKNIICDLVIMDNQLPSISSDYKESILNYQAQKIKNYLNY